MKKRLLAIILSLCLCLGILPTALAATADSGQTVGFDPNNYKGKITKISVKEPYTKDGITYLPMEVKFHVNGISAIPTRFTSWRVITTSTLPTAEQPRACPASD